jgi:hypothetical protein
MTERFNAIIRAENIVNEIVTKKQSEASKVAFNHLGDKISQDESAYWYEMRNHPTPWRSKDDQDLLQRKPKD